MLQEVLKVTKFEFQNQIKTFFPNNIHDTLELKLLRKLGFLELLRTWSHLSDNKLRHNF